MLFQFFSLKWGLPNYVNTLFDTLEELVLVHVRFFLIKTQTHTHTLDTVFHCSAELLRDSSVSINEPFDSLLRHKTPLFIRAVWVTALHNNHGSVQWRHMYLC